MIRRLIALFLTLFAAAVYGQAAPAAAPPSPRFDGALVLLSGEAEIEVPNDEAVVGFYLELQDADLARAQSQVNQKVNDGVAALKRADPAAQVETSGYSSYPVYPRDGTRKPVAWRARQSVTLRTKALNALPRTVAAGQQTLALGGIDFRVSRAAAEQVEADLLQKALARLNARMAAVAQAVRLPLTQVRTEELNFGVAPIERPLMMATARKAAAESVAEPQFDPGTTLQRLTVTAKLRLPAP